MKLYINTIKQSKTNLLKKVALVVFGIAITLQSTAQFKQPLFIPDTLSTANLDTIKLIIKETQKVFFPGASTAVIPGFPAFAGDSMPVNTYSYTNPNINNPGILGPTIIWWYGDSVTMSVENTLMDTTTTHWHGAHVAPYNDGGPHQPIPPNTTWNRTFKIRDDASTMWYHPHLHMMTMAQVNMGMAGMIITKNASDLKALKLPHTYGIDDFPIILQDKFFRQSKNSNIDSIETMCSMGTTFLVNGTWEPYLNVPAQKNRFRILNGSSERAYCLFLRDSTAGKWLPFHVIASDAGYLEKPYLMGTPPIVQGNMDSILMIMGGERYELVFDGAGLVGHDIYLMNMRNLMVGNAMIGSFAGGPSLDDPSCYSNIIDSGGMLPAGQAFDSVPAALMKIKISSPNASPANLPQTLQSYYIPDSTKAARVRKKGLYLYNSLNPTGNLPEPPPFSIDSLNFSETYINDTVYLDDIEVWKIKNISFVAHPFHIHDIHFFIQSITDTNGNQLPIPPYMKGPKDVAPVTYPTISTLVMQFNDFSTDIIDTMCYMYHCHILAHEDGGMMHQFVVTPHKPNGIKTANTQLGWNLYPSPSNGNLHIFIDNNQGGMLRMYNMMGELIKEWDAGKLNNNAALDLSNIANGTYIFKLEQPEGISTIKVTVVR